MNKMNLPTVKTDVLCIGAGIMSTTLATFLTKIYPDKKIIITEKLKDCGLESSASLNNAGTGHAGYCEMQYSPMDENGNVDISKTLKVNKGFQKSADLWFDMIFNKEIKSDFMHNVPHYSFVSGEKDVTFLRNRFNALKKNGGSFNKMTFSEDFEQIKNLLPLVMEGRDNNEPIAITKADNGLDVDFGKLTHYLANYLMGKGVRFFFNEPTLDLFKEGDKWYALQKTDVGTSYLIQADFVFIGAGGAAINLLKKAELPEAKHYAGFPVSGQWLVCRNPEIVKRHNAKVYTNPEADAPQMVAPHLDTRVVNEEKCLLFGPFAGATTKFLKTGSKWDFFHSIRFGNIFTMIGAGLRNIPMTKYLVGEVFKGKAKKFKLLQQYFPQANIEDWELVEAGLRVQTMKDVNGKGVIEFGTELVVSSDKTLTCLLGASPGASTAGSIMLDLMDKCFINDEVTKEKLKMIIPSYN